MKSLNKEEFSNLCFIIKKLDFTEVSIENQRDYMTFAIADCLRCSTDSTSIFYNLIDDLVKYIFKSFGIKEDSIKDEEYEMFYNLCQPDYDQRVDLIYKQLTERSERISFRKFILKDGDLSDLIYLSPEKLYEEYKRYILHDCNEKAFSYNSFMRMYPEEVEEWKEWKEKTKSEGDK